MRTWKDVATLVKTRGLNGRFVVRSAAGLPFVLEEGMHVHFVPPVTDAPREGEVSELRVLGDGTFEVVFDGIEDDAQARPLAGCHCLVRTSDLDEELLYEQPESWSGWRLVDVAGKPLGTIAGIVENPAQPLLEVVLEDGKSALVPAVDEFIVDVDVESMSVVADLPDGLLEL